MKDYLLNKFSNDIIHDAIYLFSFFLGLFLFGHNKKLSTIGLVVLTVTLLLNIKKTEFLLSYFMLIFFEPILHIPFFDGSFFRIYQGLFILRLALDVFNKHQYNFKKRINILASLIFFLASILYVPNLESLVSITINLIIVVYLSIYYNPTDKLKVLEKLFCFITLATIASGIYSIFFMNSIDYIYFSRATGITRDPNTSALFYTLGLFSLIGINQMNKILRIFLSVILIVFLLSTVSMSGIIGAILLLLVYYWLIDPKKAKTSFLLLFLSMFLFMVVEFEQGDFLFGLKYRVQMVFESRDFNFITSGRLNFLKSYIMNFKNLNFSHKLFGGFNTVYGDYAMALQTKIGGVSHFTYIDMLHMIGFVGTFIVIFLFILLILFNFTKWRISSNRLYLSLAFLKIIILYFGFSLSIFPFRYFYAFYIL